MSVWAPFIVTKGDGVSNNGAYTFYSSSNGTSGDIANAVTFGTVIVNQWQHIAITRSGNSIYLFVDGVLGNTINTSASLMSNSDLVRIGSDANGLGFLGGMDEIRISKGVARWTSNFTPPSNSYSVGEPDRYDIENSLQFNSASSHYLSKQFWNVGSTTRWTFSAWVKKDSNATGSDFMSAGVDSSNYTSFGFDSNNKFHFDHQVSGGALEAQKITTATYTSTTDWYHVVLAVDTTHATAANRSRVYINGTEVTSFSTDTNIPQNTQTFITDNNNNSGSNVTHAIGSFITGAASFMNGLMADVILVDGQQLNPYYFGRIDSNGSWVPIDYTGVTGGTNGPYGTNGFRLDFSDTSRLGKDRSGRQNDWTLNNIGSAQQSATTPKATTRFAANNFLPSGELFINGAIFVNGGMSVAYNLSKGAGSFVIDHVLDPMNKLLYHSFVESPDMKNIYDGVVQLNASGEATIELPKYFMALNKDFRYLGSPIGEPMPNLHLAVEVRRKWWFWGTPIFKIAGGVPSGKISWQVTGIRQDPFAKKNPIRTEVEKGPNELVDKGECLHEVGCAQDF